MQVCTPSLDQNPKIYRIPPKQLCGNYDGKAFFAAMPDSYANFGIVEHHQQRAQLPRIC